MLDVAKYGTTPCILFSLVTSCLQNGSELIVCKTYYNNYNGVKKKKRIWQHAIITVKYNNDII